MIEIYKTLIYYLIEYLSKMEWQFIFNFISLGYLVTTEYAFAILKKILKFKPRKRYVCYGFSQIIP